jgi:rubrerythrin
MTRYSKTMSEALEEVREASARADAKRAMSKDKDMKQNPFSKDDDATDDDVKAASKNIIMQLRKSVSMKGNHAVEFSDGKKKIDPKFAQAAMDKFMRIRRPDDKLKFQNKLAKSYKDLLKALKEQYEMVEVKEDYVCEDCGCPQGNADPNCSCPNDSTDLQASYWVKKESVDEEFELDEMKMNDPKLLKMFDKLKKGSKIKLKTSSTISKGKDYVEYIVKSKNTVNKGRVEKITLATVGNEGAVKKFLYKRDGTVGFAIGDMGASIDDIKEDFTPHMMYDPKTGKGYKADKEADHLRMKDMGYTHEKPDVKEAKFSDDMINKLKKAYEPMKGKKIPPGPLMKIFDKIDSNEDGLKQLYKADIPFVSVMAMSRLMLRHNYKATDINKLGKISREGFVMDEMAYKPGSFKDIRPQEKAAKAFDKLIQSGGLDKKDYQKARQLYVQASDAASREKLKKFIYNLDTEPTEAIMDLIGKNDPDTFNKMYPKSKPGEYLSSISYNHRNVKAEEVELDEKYDLYHKSFSDAMSHAYDYAKKKLGITVDPKEIDNKVATGPKKPSDGKTNTYRLKGKGGNLQIQVYNKGGSKPFELNMYKEEVELDEGVPYKFAAVDKKGLVIGFASNERDAKDMAKRNKGRVVTLTKPLPDNKKSDMMINRPFPDKMDKFPTNTSATQGKRMGEEDEKKPDNRPDSAKEVEQGRDDKKKTRIAQLQLQIAKATETINKLNTQEKQ